MLSCSTATCKLLLCLLLAVQKTGSTVHCQCETHRHQPTVQPCSGRVWWKVWQCGWCCSRCCCCGLQGFSNFCKVGSGSCNGDWNVRFRTDIQGNGEKLTLLSCFMRLPARVHLVIVTALERSTLVPEHPTLRRLLAGPCSTEVVTQLGAGDLTASWRACRSAQPPTPCCTLSAVLASQPA